MSLSLNEGALEPGGQRDAQAHSESEPEFLDPSRSLRFEPLRFVPFRTSELRLRKLRCRACAGFRSLESFLGVSVFTFRDRSRSPNTRCRIACGRGSGVKGVGFTGRVFGAQGLKGLETLTPAGRKHPIHLQRRSQGSGESGLGFSRSELLGL